MAGAAWLPGGADAASTAEQTCTASWYGATNENVEGAPTASGAPFRRTDMTAASRTLPFGTRVRVTDLGGGPAIVVEITDRGPFTDPDHRCIDLSAGAFHSLGADLCGGLTQVRVETVPTTTPLSSLAAGFRPIAMDDCPPGGGPAVLPTQSEDATPADDPSDAASVSKPRTREHRRTNTGLRPAPTAKAEAPAPVDSESPSDGSPWWLNHDAAWWQARWADQLQEMVDQQNAMSVGR
ncbi:hypothetical protein KNE206_57270 [Kitasatospora sp. NE20-6]|uniref:septal ring lytic transglycosylase RlpA family protein n=1 Tax=Kitasatospora sp. NE20-6 TaxID=2859066 RepID=UPI0034DCB378